MLTQIVEVVDNFLRMYADRISDLGSLIRNCSLSEFKQIFCSFVFRLFELAHLSKCQVKDISSFEIMIFGYKSGFKISCHLNKILG